MVSVRPENIQVAKIKSIKSSTHYLIDTIRFDVSSKGPSVELLMLFYVATATYNGHVLKVAKMCLIAEARKEFDNFRMLEKNMSCLTPLSTHL